ncbi:MAG TPA: GrpB family protein [Ktedonobacteraceae bacterium]|nr:GrpB family protein [Ktedonobacteraceae bacterium]
MIIPIILVDYDPNWPTLFQELRDRVAAVLGDLVVVIEHVGSTSIPGCPAKPIIDMDVVISSMTDLPQTIAQLATLGYVHQGNLGIAGREAFAAPPDAPPHHLYVCSAQSEEFYRHILFRDYLRAHPEEVQAYAILKQKLAHQFRHDRDAYSKGKNEFVAMILQSAAQDT